MVDCESECWSDDSEVEKLSRSMSSGSSKIWDSVSDDSGYEIDGISSLMRDKLGYVEFQYFESAKPHLRVPLTAKVLIHFISSDPIFFILPKEPNFKNISLLLVCFR